jgi:DNA-binding helix-hairpin-helix protein with protein kinase domain
MNPPELYLGRIRLNLAKRIGKGGEGEVWLNADEPKQAVKFYTLKDLASREAKVRAMVKLGLAGSSKLVAYPVDPVTTRSGGFAGFTMNLIDGGQQIHELYGVKSRKIHFPAKDYRFLIRAAANTARAVGQVHTSPCVIGDFNHSGVLVGNDATVALIDADSFQLEAEQTIFPCLVGVPDFTPPELQGKSLSQVTRTKVHDRFGLAVAIFQLLFMGRHPYAGTYEGPDLALDGFIARNLFAYSQARATGVTRPPGMIGLDAFPPNIASGFESAFGVDPDKRPTAAEWVGHLEALEGQLSRCAADKRHFYPTSAKSCPWCQMEAASGAILFLPFVGGGVSRPIDLGAFDLEKAWAAIRAIVVPEAASVTPALPALPNTPSEEARKAQTWFNLTRGGGVIAGIAAIGAWAIDPSLGALWIAALVAAVSLYNSKRIDILSWQKRYGEADRWVEDALHQWRTRLGHTQLVVLRAEMEKAVGEYRGLPPARTSALEQHKAQRRQRQLNEYLDRFLIGRATISGIGPAKTVTLRSFGIESAADVQYHRILGISGFGPATADKLMAWRAGIERRFVYNPAPTASDAAAQARLEAEFASKQAALARKISGGKVEMAQIAATIQQRVRTEDVRIAELAKSRSQLAADLAHLLISRPSPAPSRPPVQPVRPAPQAAPLPRPVQRPTANPLGTMACPQCGSVMVKRVARRGNNIGRSFWGCSRYPICKATRP